MLIQFCVILKTTAEILLFNLIIVQNYGELIREKCYLLVWQILPKQSGPFQRSIYEARNCDFKTEHIPVWLCLLTSFWFEFFFLQADITCSQSGSSDLPRDWTVYIYILAVDTRFLRKTCGTYWPTSCVAAASFNWIYKRWCHRVTHILRFRPPNNSIQFNTLSNQKLWFANIQTFYRHMIEIRKVCKLQAHSITWLFFQLTL